MDVFNQGWWLTVLLLCLCVAGCLIIFVDDIYNFIFPRCITERFPFRLKDNFAFLVNSLSFSSGCLIFTSLYRLLPEAYHYFDESVGPEQANFYLVICFVSGTLICLLLNWLLHLATSESVVHCAHDGPHEEHSGHEHDGNGEILEGYGSHDPEDQVSVHSHHSHTHLHGHVLDTVEATESTPLVPKRHFSIIHLLTEAAEGECKGYTSAEVCINDQDDPKLHYCELPTLGANSTHSIHSVHSKRSHNDVQLHHHHVSTPVTRLLMIGVQTVLAIVLHKLPEGFITYITSEANKELGIEIFLSLLVHNYIEGFSMCLPLYYSFSSTDTRLMAKVKALIISGGLGGISQPLGALIGYWFLSVNKSHDIDYLAFVFGASIGVTSGFLLVISLNMFGSAVSFNNKSVTNVIVWCVLGLAVILLSLLL